MSSLTAALVGAISYTLFSFYGAVRRTKEDNAGWHIVMSFTSFACCLWLAFPIFDSLFSAIVYSFVAYLFMQGVEHFRCFLEKYAAYNAAQGGSKK